MSEWSERLQQRQAAGLYRQQAMHRGAQGRELSTADGRMYLNFCSNDYLGLAADPAVIAALCAGAQRYGVGAGSSHLVCGHQQIHAELENFLCQWTGRQRALLFSSGWLANLAVVAGLTGKGEVVLQDRLNHASLLDAVAMANASLRRYAHADSAAAQRQLERRKTRLLITDAVFSMDGDQAPLAALSALASTHAALLAVDDAHGIGVLGDQGQGWGAGFSQEEVPLLVLTFGKALGTQGACVLGSEEMIDWLTQSARPYIYTTALSPALAAATLESAQRAQQDHWRRSALQERIRYFRTGAAALGLPLQKSATAIQPLLIGAAAKAQEISHRLLQQGIWVTAIRPPTVPAGTSRLRITLSVAHTLQDIDRLLTALAAVWPPDDAAGSEGDAADA